MSDTPLPPGSPPSMPPPGPPPAGPPPGSGYGPPPGPPPASPPPPGAPGGGGPRPSPQVDISRWLQEAWALIQPVWLEVILVVLILQVITSVAFVLCILPGLLVIGPLTGGLFVYMAKRMLGRPAQIGDIFLGFRRFVPTTILALTLFLVPAVIFAILYLPTIFAGMGSNGYDYDGAGGGFLGAMGCLSTSLALLFILVYPIVVGTFLVFAFPLVMFRDRDAVTAMRESLERVKPHMGGFLLLLVAQVVLLLIASSVGSLLCGVGTLVTSPLAYGLLVGMQLAAFRDYFGLREGDLAGYQA